MNSRQILIGIFLLLVAARMSAAPQQLALADPFIFFHGNTYYAYGTSDANGIVVYTSDDSRFWTKQSTLALHKKDSYADRWFWAPEVYFLNGQFYMYYSADEHICVATADSPLGPFTQDVQEPMLPDKAIDHSLFIDDDGKAYLFFVRFTDGNAIWMAELESDYKTIKPYTMRLCFAANTSGWEADMGKINEGPFVIKHKGYYYLTYSANHYQSQNYGVGFAFTADINNSWTKYNGNPILQRPNGLSGSGHHCLFRDKDDLLKMAFHAHKSETSVNPRETYITSVEFTNPPRGLPIMTVSPDWQPTYILNTAFGGDLQPLMGWSSWNANRVYINEALIKETADSMVSLGLKNHGYSWVNIDDGFFNGRDASGNLRVNSKFPNGMKTISDYIRAKGLNPGIYSEIGQHTCASLNEGDEAGKNSGLYGHEVQDLKLFFDTWKYDFIKVDYCGGIHQGLNERERYTRVGNIIDSLENVLGRRLRYNICRWSFPGTWARDVADSWRVSGDIWDHFSSIASIVDLNTYLAPYCSPGKYNDMDMLQLGRGLNEEEEKTHFGMWAIMSSPLVIGCNFAGIRQSTLDILKNAEVIAVNQDTLGLQAEVVSRQGGAMVFAKPIEQRRGRVRAVALYNPTFTQKNIRVRFADIQLSEKARVRDLWKHSDLGEFTEYYETSVPAHGTAMLRVEGDSAIDKTIYQGEYAYMNKFAAIDLAENARFERIDHFATSGGAILHWLGNSAENWAEYRDVYVSKGGKYTFKLFYISAENRNLTVDVNGEKHSFSHLNSGGWDKRATAEIEIQLRAGSNVIRLENATAWAPNIDKFELIPEGEEAKEDPFEMEPGDATDEDSLFPQSSSLDNTNEHWYHIVFKENGCALQDMGEDALLLTKYLEEETAAQHWKIVTIPAAKDEYVYWIVSGEGRSLWRDLSFPESPDGFYRTTSAENDWERFRLVATGHNDLKPAWEIERSGANGRRLNQYNPTMVYGSDKRISEWEADDHGNPVLFVPIRVGAAITSAKTESGARIVVESKQVNINGDDIRNVSLFTLAGVLVEQREGVSFSFLSPVASCYIAVIRYKDNRCERIKLIVS